VRIVRVVALALAVAPGLAGGEAPPRDDRLRLPVVRLLETAPPALPEGLVWGRYVRIADEERPALTSHSSSQTLVPPLDARDVVSAPFDVPAEARLDVAIGVEETAPSTEATPIEFRVVAESAEGTSVLDRRTYDPRAEDRRWRDVRIDLSSVAGRTVRLRLSTVALDAAPPGGSLPVWADPVVSAPKAGAPLNVVVVSLDTLRAKSVSAYGAARRTTPALDEVVGGAGTIFDAAYTSVPHTLWGHLAVFTGRYLRNLNGTSPLRDLPPDIPTLTERLRAAGYTTAAITEDGFIIPRIGFRRGFSEYRENTSPDMRLPLGQSAKTFREGVAWLARHRDQPVFLFLHTYEVHEPYLPPPPYDTAFEPGAGPETVPAVELLRYEQEARHLDDELRGLVESIDALGLATRTLLVVLADHGEEFMEHGQTRHSWQLYEESIHVPLMMRLPGIVPVGLRIATPVSLVDVAPTILDVVGAPPISGVDGVSLLPLLAGRPLPDWRRAVFSEAMSSRQSSGIDLVSARVGQVRCTLRTRSGSTLCYDLTRDPEETAPLGPIDRRSAAARSEAAAYADLLAHAPPNPSLAAPAPSTDPGRAEKLRALGYVE
jgi:arylsulfatase A-like enzyme